MTDEAAAEMLAENDDVAEASLLTDDTAILTIPKYSQLGLDPAKSRTTMVEALENPTLGNIEGDDATGDETTVKVAVGLKSMASHKV